jgi:hypothetical protein
MPETMILEGLQEFSRDITHKVKKQLKEKLTGLSVEEIIKKVKAETKSAYKATAEKKIAEVLENVLA